MSAAAAVDLHWSRRRGLYGPKPGAVGSDSYGGLSPE